MSKKYQPKDRFYQRAKEDNFAARSVYKLEEIDQKFQLISPGAVVVDLGCSPGSWLQYLSSAVGQRGVVVGYDLVEPRVSAGSNVIFHLADVFQLTPERIRADLNLQDNLQVDALLSDMAPKTSGIRDSDQARSIALVEAAVELALALLKPSGVFAAKTFQGRGFDELLLSIRKRFEEVKVLRPEATREGSRELFLIAKRPRSD